VASSKKKLLVVQAMSDLRMKKVDSIIADVNNLIVCCKILEGSEKGKNGSSLWDRRDEVLDLFSVYYWKTQDQDKAKELQSILKIDDAECQSLKSAVDDGSLRWAEESKDEQIFF